MADTPISFHLTPNGKTLVTIFADYDELTDVCINILGEPEGQSWSEENPGILHLLFPHQDMPDDLKDIAERMTSETLLTALQNGVPISARACG